METSDSTSSPTRQPPNEEEDDQERHDSSKEERNEQRSHFTDERLFGSSLFSEPIAYTRLRHGGDRFVDDFVLYALATTHISQNTRTFFPTSCPCPSSQVLLVSYSFNNSYLGSLLYGVVFVQNPWVMHVGGILALFLVLASERTPILTRLHFVPQILLNSVSEID